jgi:hypothetical protein
VRLGSNPVSLYANHTPLYCGLHDSELTRLANTRFRIAVVCALVAACCVAWFLYLSREHSAAKSESLAVRADSTDAKVTSRTRATGANQKDVLARDTASLKPHWITAPVVPLESFSEVYARADELDPAAAFETRATILLTCLQVKRDSAKTMPNVVLAAQALAPTSEESNRARAHLRNISELRRCAGFALPADAYAQAKALMARAAALGSHTAKVFLIEDSLNQSFEPIRTVGLPKDHESFHEPVGSTARLSPAQFDTLVDAMKSGEPKAIVAAAPTLLGWFRESETVVDSMPGNSSMDDLVIHAFADILACRVGAACGEDSLELLGSCAIGGECGFRSFEDYYASRLHDPRYRAAVDFLLAKFENAYRTGDWSFLVLKTNTAGNLRLSVPFRLHPRFSMIGR